MAYLKDLPKPKCCTCLKPAKVALHNFRNAELGFYCHQCSKLALRTQKVREEQEP